MPDLLIELFSEEIPARMQAKAAADLRRMMTDGLVEAGLTYEGAVAHATPRRLCLSVHSLSDASPTTTEDRRGPREGAPEKAVEGFAKGAGVAVDALDLRDEKKGRAYYASVTTPGRPAEAIVAEVLDRAIRDFPWPKSMRWGDGTLRWVRPLRRILCVLTREDGHAVVPLTVDGIEAGDVTEGHRFMAPAPFSVTGFDDYEAKLKRAFVVLSAEERMEAIRQEMGNRAFASGLEVVKDDALLAEVAGLVEWPVVLMGRIAEDYLSLPPEVLRTSMKEHQKFFSVRDRTGTISRFVTVANRETADDGATIIAGNARVLSARLADAAFFWENDLRVAKAGMGDWLDKLANVTFHAKLGSQKDRTERIAALAREIAPAVGADPDQAERAAKLAKADLASEMVYEFPELQGVMGRYYALEAEEPEAVANAARDHYAPLGPSDDVPTEPVSVAVALADKIDTLTGFWAIDEKPTGSKDPYALRRAALGVIRLLNDSAPRPGPRAGASASIRDGVSTSRISLLPFLRRAAEPIEDLIAREAEKEILEEEHVAATYFGTNINALRLLRSRFDEERPEAAKTAKRLEVASAIANIDLNDLYDPDEELLTFLHDRLKVFLRDRGIRHDVIDASLAMPGSDDLALLTRRAEALQAFLDTEDGGNLTQGFRRADNILRQAEQADGVEYSYGPDPGLADTDEERALFTALDAAEPKIDAAMADEDFAAAMRHMAALRPPVDAFFEAVQVNSDSAVLRRNRLNLLHRIRSACLRVADLRRLTG